MSYFVGINQLPLTSASPAANEGTVTTGTSTDYARADHDHGDATSLKSATTSVSINTATAPSSGQVLTATSGTTATWQTPSGGGVQVAILQDLQADATQGQALTNGSWTTRTLNTETDPSGIVTLTSNQFTLGAGTYVVSWECLQSCTNTSAQGGTNGATRLRNVTDATSTARGTTIRDTDIVNNNRNISSHGDVVFTIAVSKTFELQHFVDTLNQRGGANYNSGVSAGNCYATVRIDKIG